VAGTFIAQPFAYVFVAVHRTRMGLLLQALLTIVPILAFLSGAQNHSISSALVYSAAATFIGSIILIWAARHYVRKFPVS
jgi:hypothetical protein